MDNKEFLKRAAITTDAIAAAGKMTDQQANKFIDYVFDLSVLKNITRQVRFTSDNYYINKIGVGDRVAWPAAEAQDPGFRRGVSTSRVALNPKDIVVPFEISDRFVRFNVEGGSVEDHVIRMMAGQLANDIDQLFLDGNTVGPARVEDEIFLGGSSTLFRLDRFLALTNGYLKLAESATVYDAANAALSGSIFNKAILNMPVKYRKNMSRLRFMSSPDHEQGYREKMSTRNTSLGDTALQSPNPLTPFGVPVLGIPMLERNPLYVENSVGNTDGTTPTDLTYAPHDNLALLPTSLGDNLTAKYILATDYTEVEAAGTWTSLLAAITTGMTVKATYNTKGKMLLTDPQNLIYAIGMDVSIEKDRNIYKRMNEYAIHVSVDCQIENLLAMVMVKNLADPTL